MIAQVTEKSTVSEKNFLKIVSGNIPNIQAKEVAAGIYRATRNPKNVKHMAARLQMDYAWLYAVSYNPKAGKFAPQPLLKDGSHSVSALKNADGKYSLEQAEKYLFSIDEALSAVSQGTADHLGFPMFTAPRDGAFHIIMLDIDDKAGDVKTGMPAWMKHAFAGCFVEFSKSGKGWHVFANVPEYIVARIRDKLGDTLGTRHQFKDVAFGGKEYGFDIDFEVTSPSGVIVTGEACGEPWEDLDGRPKDRSKFLEVLEKLGMYPGKQERRKPVAIGKTNSGNLDELTTWVQQNQGMWLGEKKCRHYSETGLQDLLNGDPETLLSFGGQSEAEWAACSMLARATQDAELIYRYLSDNAQLVDREKWKLRKDDYALRTIKKAIGQADAYFTRAESILEKSELQGFDLIKDSEGVLINNSIANAEALINMSKRYNGVFAYNVLHQKACVRKQLQDDIGDWWQLGAIYDQHTAQVATDFERWGYVCAEKQILGAIHNTVRRDHFSPLKDAVKALPEWDGIPRLDSVGFDYFGVSKDDEQEGRLFNEQIRRFLIGCIARAWTSLPLKGERTAAKMDTVLMLAGAQGETKSEVVRILGSGIAPDATGTLTEAIAKTRNSKDLVAKILGKLVVEMPEGAALFATNQDEAAQVKAFITQGVDEERLAYGGKDSGGLGQPYIRTACFIATLNPSSSLSLFFDPTGGRRWWYTPTGRIDLTRLKEDVKQIWAEAFSQYLEGAKWWFDQDSEFGKLQSEIIQSLTTENPLDGFIRRATDKVVGPSATFTGFDLERSNNGINGIGGFTTEELWHWIKSPRSKMKEDFATVLGGDADTGLAKCSKRIDRSLRAIGFEQWRVMQDGKRQNRWFKPLD